MLSSSPWAQTQVDTNTSEIFYSPTLRLAITPSRMLEGAINQEIKLVYYVRFFTARPVHEALARLYQIKEKPTSEAASGLHNFAELKPTKPSSPLLLDAAMDVSPGKECKHFKVRRPPHSRTQPTWSAVMANACSSTSMSPLDQMALGPFCFSAHR
jgi:hypothetical protein